MSVIARVGAICCLMILAACAGGQVAAPPAGQASGWTITDSSVRFGPDIGRTESGVNFNSNFVWDGYTGGNRKKQVVALFENAIDDVAATMSGPRDVKLNVVVTRFHALTNDSRVWCCGEHNIVADLEVVDARSGDVLASGQDVYLGRVALGGIPGLVATAAGRDQIVRVREGIARGVRDWLSAN